MCRDCSHFASSSPFWETTRACWPPIPSKSLAACYKPASQSRQQQPSWRMVSHTAGKSRQRLQCMLTRAQTTARRDGKEMGLEQPPNAGEAAPVALNFAESYPSMPLLLKGSWIQLKAFLSNLKMNKLASLFSAPMDDMIPMASFCCSPQYYIAHTRAFNAEFCFLLSHCISTTFPELQ